MKKYLLFISIFFISSIGVCADEQTKIQDPLECFNLTTQSTTKNLFKKDWGNEEKACLYVNKYFYSYTELNPSTSKYYCNKNFIEVKPNTNYTFTLFDSSLTPINSFGNDYIYLFDENFTQVLKKQSFFSPPYNFTTTETSKYFLFCTYTTFNSINQNYLISNIQLEEAEITSLSDLAFIEYSEIPKEDEENNPIIIPDSTLDDFYNIFNSKLKLLASYTLENKYLFSVIGIVVLFAVLGIFFKIFRIGGGR